MKVILIFLVISTCILSCKKETLPRCGEVTSVEFYEINDPDKIVVSIVLQFPAPVYQEKFVFVDDRERRDFWEENYRKVPNQQVCRATNLWRWLRIKGE